MYKLTYWINKRMIETTLTYAPKAVCQWRKQCLSETTHKQGEFKIEKL